MDSSSAAFDSVKTPSRHALDGAIITIHHGVAIYKTLASRFWHARIRDPRQHRYVVRSTKEISRILARAAALELAKVIWGSSVATPREFTFAYYATRFVERGRGLVSTGERNANYIRTSHLMLNNDAWGLVKHFGHEDVRQLRTRHWAEYLNQLSKTRPDLSASTRNMLSATFRNVLKVSRDDGVIDAVPDTPRTKQHDNPRPFFRFAPLVSAEQDTYQRLLNTAQVCIGEPVRGVPITGELLDIILFTVGSFVRPISTELYALRWADIQLAEKPQRLLITIRDGKTGARIANSTQEAVTAWQSQRARYPNAVGEDPLFLPDYANRATAARIIARWFNHVLDREGIKHDPVTNSDHSLYSLRHTAICRRIILSQGQVNIYNLAKNAGTSVEQIERFYARNLPLSAEMARNLQSVGV